MKDHNNISPELLETIERYDSGLMAPEERLLFEEQLRNDAAFKMRVKDIRIILLGIETQALTEQLETFHKELPEHHQTLKSIKKKRFLSFFKIAIAAGLIIALGIFWMLGNSSSQRLYSRHFKPDPGLPTNMGTSVNFVFYDAMVNYKQNDYKTAISKWEKLELIAPENDTINYFLGVAYLADKNAEKAIPYLKKIANNPKSAFLEDAHHYLGLAYLKLDKTEEAVQEFQKSTSERNHEILKALQ